MAEITSVMDNPYSEMCGDCGELNYLYIDNLFEFDAYRCWYCKKLHSINDKVQLERGRIVDGEEI